MSSIEDKRISRLATRCRMLSSKSILLRASPAHSSSVHRTAVRRSWFERRRSSQQESLRLASIKAAENECLTPHPRYRIRAENQNATPRQHGELPLTLSFMSDNFTAAIWRCIHYTRLQDDVVFVNAPNDIIMKQHQEACACTIICQDSNCNVRDRAKSWKSIRLNVYYVAPRIWWKRETTGYSN